MNRFTPAAAVASMALIAPSLSTVLVRSGFPPPAPAAQRTVVAFVDLMVWVKSATEESSMDWTLGLPPRDLMSRPWELLRMMLWTVCFSSEARRWVMCWATLPLPPKMRVFADILLMLALTVIYFDQFVWFRRCYMPWLSVRVNRVRTIDTSYCFIFQAFELSNLPETMDLLIPSNG